MKIVLCMVPEIWSATDRIFGHFGPFFCPFTQLTTQKIKILKKWKKHLQISSFYTSVPKIMTICYTVPEIWPVTDVNFIFHFGLFFAHLMWKKNENNCRRYHHFTHVYQKVLSDDVWFLRNGAQQMVGQTDEKSDIRGGCPN